MSLSWPNDPLRFGVDLPLTALFHPLGYPVRLATNSPDVLLAAEESWCDFPQFFSAPPINLRVSVEDDGSAECASSIMMRGQGHLLSAVSDAKNSAILDSSRRFAYCSVTAATARNRPWFRYFYLDAMINLMLWRTHLTRIHAGCVALKDQGVLLCGASGAGKSCLTYACARRGWALISDEAPSIVRRTDERIVIGKPQTIHLREGAFGLFPELMGREVKRNPVGKLCIEVRTAEIPGLTTAYRCHIAALVFLNRDIGSGAELAPLPKEEAWQRLADDLPFFGEPAHNEHKASLRNLLGAGVFELHYADPEPAVAELERLIAGRGTG